MEGTLVIDLDVCRSCPTCEVACSYFHHPRNEGVLALRELAARAYLCRRCEEPACVAACGHDALSRDDDGIVRRSDMRCVGCQSCVIACFQGTLTPDLVPYLVPACDRCRDRGEPTCVRSCDRGAIRWVAELPEGAERVADGVVVQGATWRGMGG